MNKKEKREKKLNANYCGKKLREFFSVYINDIEIIIIIITP